MSKLPILALLLFCMGVASNAAAQDDSTEALAKAAQNPVANMISVPFQENLNFGVGPYNQTQSLLNIQPVVPFSLTPDWNLITRTIIPVLNQPRLSPTIDPEFGIGDINPTFFVSPSKPGSIIWGAGPTFLLPTATDRYLGTGKWSAGPSVVVLTTPGPWVLGILASNVWSFAGPSSRANVNTFSSQLFVNYNLPQGWYLTTSPIITANWTAPASQRWTVPVGGGIGRIFKVGGQALNAQLGGYYNVVRPDGAATWQLRAQLVFLFPK